MPDPRPPWEIVGLIPAAGRATRLAPLPCSKELLPVGFLTPAEGADRKPKPVSQYLLDRMKLAGARKVFFIARQGKWDIADYYADGSRLGLQLAYLHVGAPWGPPFTLTQAAPFIGDADVVFGFPDILIDPPDSFNPLLARMQATGADVVLGLFQCRADEPGDVIQTDGNGRVTGLETKEERPVRPDRYVCWMFAVWRHTFTRFMTEHCRQLAAAGGRDGAPVARREGARMAGRRSDRGGHARGPARRQRLLRVGALPRRRHAGRNHRCGPLSGRLERRRSAAGMSMQG